MNTSIFESKYTVLKLKKAFSCIRARIDHGVGWNVWWCNFNTNFEKYVLHLYINSIINNLVGRKKRFQNNLKIQIYSCHPAKTDHVIKCLLWNVDAVGLKPSKHLTKPVQLHLFNTWFIQQCKNTLMLIWLMCLCGRFPMQCTLHTAKSFQGKW